MDELEAWVGNVNDRLPDEERKAALKAVEDHRVMLRATLATAGTKELK